MSRLRVASICFFFVLACIFLGALYSDPREFVKIRLGPLFILEIATFFLLISGLASWRFQELRSELFTTLKGLRPVLLFTSYGLCLVLIDVLSRSIPNKEVSLTRAAQLSLLIVYPALWGLIGWGAYRINSKWMGWLILGISFWNAVPNFTGHNVSQISMGPTLGLFWVGLLTLFLTRELRITPNFKLSIKSSLNLRLILIPILVSVGFSTNVPFWKMWVTSMQRTSLILLLAVLTLGPWILNRYRGLKATSAQSLVTSLLALGVLFGGFPFASSIRDIENFGRLDQDLGAAIRTISKQIVLSTQDDLKKTFQKEDDGSNSRAEPSKPSPTQSSSSKNAENKVGTSREIKPEIKLDQPSTFNSKPIEAEESSSFSFGGRTRKYMWRRTLEDWLEASSLGIVFGLRFHSNIPSWVLPWHKNDQGYAEASPVVGPHNSYLSVLARTGLIGFTLFLLIFRLVWRCSKQVIRSHQFSLVELVLVFIPWSGAIYSLLNVGFESPHHAFIFWFFVGALVARGFAEDKIQGAVQS